LNDFDQPYPPPGMILRVAIHPKNRLFRTVTKLGRDRLGMDGGLHLLGHARGFRFGSLGK
jgi:hypothetical protein